MNRTGNFKHEEVVSCMNKRLDNYLYASLQMTVRPLFSFMKLILVVTLR